MLNSPATQIVLLAGWLTALSAWTGRAETTPPATVMEPRTNVIARLYGQPIAEQDLISSNLAARIHARHAEGTDEAQRKQKWLTFRSNVLSAHILTELSITNGFFAPGLVLDHPEVDRFRQALLQGGRPEVVNTIQNRAKLQYLDKWQSMTNGMPEDDGLLEILLRSEAESIVVFRLIQCKLFEAFGGRGRLFKGTGAASEAVLRHIRREQAQGVVELLDSDLAQRMWFQLSDFERLDDTLSEDELRDILENPWWQAETSSEE